MYRALEILTFSEVPGIVSDTWQGSAHQTIAQIADDRLALFSPILGSPVHGAQCAGNQIIKESAGQKPPIQSVTHALSTALARLCLAIILTSPLHGRYTGIVPRGRMQQLLIYGLKPELAPRT